MTEIGVLALQGDVAEHEAMLAASGANPTRVKRADQIDELDGLVIPGGESTTIGKLLRRFHLLEPLQQKVRAGFPVFGTCAGMILLANQIDDAAADQPSIGGMNITVLRNAFGRQRESFETDLTVPAVGDIPLHAVFIRAPLITHLGTDVTALASLDDGRTVAARQDHLLVASFHPELTDDSRLHRYFVEMVRERS